jgi:shikimate kinase
MGSGKTAVGKQLAQALGLEFVDSDRAVEERTGVEIAYIFEREGEAGFRARERDAIDELSARDGQVLATGGGAILDPDTRARLRERGHVVYLRTSVGQQLARTRRSQTRPLLRSADPRATLERLMEVRRPLYESTAHLIADTDGRKVASVVGEIVRQLRAGTREAQSCAT